MAPVEYDRRLDYAWTVMYRQIIFFAALSFAICAQADIYRWVDESGRVQFSDRPREGSQALDSKVLTPDSSQRDQVANDPDESSQAVLGPYEAFEIVSPEPNQTLRQEQTDVPFSLVLSPSLMDGHRLELILDSASVAIERSLGTQVSLNGLTLGSHAVVARILDQDGAIVAQTVPLTFHLRKPLPPGVLQ